MFRIKICGITTVDDAQMVAAAGADAIGLNCYPPSKRYVPPDLAGQIALALPAEVVRVGVFVGASADAIRETIDRMGLDMIQLHGDESPEFVGRLNRCVPAPVIRAFRLGPDGVVPINKYLQQCAELACRVRMILIDAYEPGSYGGTGRTFDWTAVRSLSRAGRIPLVLAGGLTPDNVAEAIRAGRPAAVDVASGVESSPGRKDERLVRAFVEAAQAAFRQTHRPGGSNR